jgi:hypothetical protein
MPVIPAQSPAQRVEAALVVLAEAALLRAE